MNLERFRSYLKKDGWLLAAIALCAGLCLLLGTAESHAGSEEERISRVLSAMEGAGQVEVAVYSEEAIPCGAVIVADGAYDVSVRLRLSTAVSALLGLSPERIAVYPRQGGNVP